MQLRNKSLGILLILALAHVGEALQTPTSPLGQDSTWLVIESEQTITSSSKLLAPNIKWLVREYFCDTDKLAYSIHENTETNQTYELLSWNSGKFYLKRGPAEGGDQFGCEVDQRHDYETLLPWSYWLKSFRLSGVTALWKNLIGFNCDVVNSRLHCARDSNHAEFSMDFDLETSGPLSGKYLGRNVIWSDQATILDWVRQEFEVSKFRIEKGRPDEIKERLELREKLCRSLNHYASSSLPGVMKVLTESESRTYRMQYSITISHYNEATGSNRAATRHQVEEWFSFDHGIQSITRQIASGVGQNPDEKSSEPPLDKHKLIQLFNHEHGTSLGYKVDYSVSGKAKSCELSRLDEDEILAVIAPRMKRRIRFAPNESDSASERNVGQLIGLGALLMHYAEVRWTSKCDTKCIEEITHHPAPMEYDYGGFPIGPIQEDEGGLDYYGDPVEPANGYTTSEVKYVLKEIYEAGHRILLKFKGSNTDIRYLLQVEIFSDNVLKAKIESFSITTDVEFAEKLEHPFEIPPICPPAGDDFIEPVVVRPAAECDKQLEAGDQFSFPSSGQWHAYLKENYKLGSKWSLRQTSGNQLEAEYDVIEYLTIAGSNELLGRIDVRQANTTVKFVLIYDDDVQFRMEANECTLVAKLDHWLQVASAEMHLAGYHETGRHEPLRHFGLGGLWLLASRQSDSLDLVDLSKREASASEFVATWMMHDVAELAPGTSVKFSFITRPDRALEGLSLEAREAASVLERVEIRSGELSISVSDLRVEPNQATRDAFAIAPGCPPVNRATKLRFPTILDELRRADLEPDARPLPERDFQLSYELLWSSQNATLLIQVTETNLPQAKLRFTSMSFVNGDTLERTHVTFWRRETEDGPEVVLDYQFRGQERVCSRAPELERLMQLEAHLKEIGGSAGLIELAGLPLASVWHEFAGGLEQSPGSYHAQTRSIDGDKLHTIWTLNYDAQIGSLLLETRPDETKLERLRSVTIEKSLADDLDREEVEMSFRLTQIGPVKDLERVLASSKPPTGCKHLDRRAKLPHLSDYLARGSRLSMRSEVTRLDSVSDYYTVLDRLSEIHFLDEWLALDEAYRSRYTTDAVWLEENLINFDQLILPQTREYFDLSEANQCKTSGLDAGSTTISPNVSTGGFISASLFNSEHKVGFFGPISLWLLAQDSNSKQILFDGAPARSGHTERDRRYQLHFLHLFDDLHFRDWLQTDRWLVTHKTFGSFVMVFKPQEGASEATRLERVHQVADGHPLDVQVINYRFETNPASFEAFDQFLRIPAGQGCVRGREAKARAKLRPRDLVSFDETIPFEFYYEASLKVLDSNGSQPAALNSGRLMACPERWTTMLTGPLRVNLHEVHHLAGKTSASRRIVMRELHSSRRSTIRLLDELNGRCQIDIDRANPFERVKMLELDFDGELVSFSMAQLVELFDSMGKFELLQEFESAKGGDRGKQTTVVLEAKSEMLKLNERLAGPGSIVRTFVRDATSKERGRLIYHEAAKVELIVHEKAHLTLNINKMHFVECFEVIDEIKAGECRDDKQEQRARHFEMTFEPIDFDPAELNSNANLLESEFSYGEFLSNWKYLEHDLQRVFFTPPDRIPVSQLGRIELKLSSAHSKLVASFDLLEPISLLHEFDLLPGHEINPEMAKGLEQVVVERRAVGSELQCASDCESQPHSCLAFSYCANRFCTSLQVPNWSRINETSLRHTQSTLFQSIRDKLSENSQCSTHFWPSGESYAERRYVDEIVARIRDQIESPKASNKFALSMKFHSNRKTRTKFVATELREKLQAVDGKNEADVEHRKGKPTGELVVLAQLADFDPLELGSKMPSIKITTLETSSLIDCLGACRSSGCQLAAFCPDARVCSLMAHLNEWAQLEAALAGGHRHSRGHEHCTIYSQDFTQHFELFDETREPDEFVWRHSEANVVECAARCQLEPGCLSFDFCPAPATPTCYGQRSHVSSDRMLSTDDEFQPGLLNSGRCSHYSKLVLEDFEVMPSTRFAEHNSIIFHSVGLEHCASLCRRDTSCKSFEYCTKASKWSNTCYTETRPLKSSADQSDSSTDSDRVETIELSDCSIYVLSSEAPNETLATNERNVLVERPQDLEGEMKYRNTSLLCLIALILGICIGVVHQKVAPDRNRGKIEPM